MLNQKEISEFERVKSEIISLLEHDQVIDVVPKRLYLKKNSRWSLRFVMSDAQLGTQTLQELLKQFVWATTNIVASEEVIRDNELGIFGRVLTAMEDTVIRLKECKNE